MRHHGRVSRAATPTPDRFGSAPSRVLRHLRRSGTLTREELADRSGLSSATIARTVSALVAERLVRERHDLIETAGRGRPHVPLQIDDRHFVCVGVHLGHRLSTVALGSLTGEILAARVLPQVARVPDIGAIAGEVATLLNSCLTRVPIAAAVVAAFERIGVEAPAIAAELSDRIGLPVALGSQVGSLAGVEFMLRGYRASEPTTYLYLRDVAGSVQMVEQNGEVLSSHALDLAHLPTGSSEPCWCGRVGCLEATASDRAVAGRAMARGLIDSPRIPLLVAAAAQGNAEARTVLVDRATILGRAAATVRDLVRPRHLVAFGQAFTDDPARHPAIRNAWAETPPGATELTFSSVGQDLQARGAVATALGSLFADPHAALQALE